MWLYEKKVQAQSAGKDTLVCSRTFFSFYFLLFLSSCHIITDTLEACFVAFCRKCFLFSLVLHFHICESRFIFFCTAFVLYLSVFVFFNQRKLFNSKLNGLFTSFTVLCLLTVSSILNNGGCTLALRIEADINTSKWPLENKWQQAPGRDYPAVECWSRLCRTQNTAARAVL